jgi:deoxyribonuclease-4
MAGKSNILEKCDIREVADYCFKIGLDLFEYPIVHGLPIHHEVIAQNVKSAFDGKNIALSVHAPYYTNFSNPDPAKIESTMGYVSAALLFAKEVGSDRIIVHPGSQRDLSRSDAMSIALENLAVFGNRIDLQEPNNVYIYLETLGIIRQMGTVEEILQMCSIHHKFVPCLDFGHINSRYCGLLKKEPSNYEDILKLCKDTLPENKINRLHIHFSKIIYGNKGERSHTTFADDIYGPDFEPMIDALIKLNINANIICESAGTQDMDALTMKQYYSSKVYN